MSLVRLGDMALKVVEFESAAMNTGQDSQWHRMMELMFMIHLNAPLTVFPSGK